MGLETTMCAQKSSHIHDALAAGHLLMMEQVTVQMKQAMNHH